MKNRLDFFTKEVVDGITENDYLGSALPSLSLTTADSHRVTEVTEYRPDLVSFKFFGSYNYGWLIALHNNMLDPISEMTRGRRIFIPDLTEYYRVYLRERVSSSNNAR